MNRLEQLTANPDKCDELVALGIIPKAIIWWLREIDQEAIDKAAKAGKPLDYTPMHWDACLLEDPMHISGSCIPAWTKAELDVMIGPELPKPDLYTAEKLGNSRVQDAETYPIFFPTKLEVYTNGAQASAVALKWLIENKIIDVDGCNHRYFKVFKQSKS